MFGFKSLEQKLRDGNGRTAPATVLEINKGKSINWTVKGPSGYRGTEMTQGTVAKNRFKLRVEPAGEPPFEADVEIPEDQLSLNAVGVGSTVIVLFDPDDHDKLVVDIKASKVQLRARLKGVSPEQAEQQGAILRGALAAAESGNMPQYIEQVKAEAMARAEAARSGLNVQGTPMVMPGGGSAKLDVADELTKLADLRDRGVLTEAEFEAQKAKILAAG